MGKFMNIIHLHGDIVEELIDEAVDEQIIDQSRWSTFYEYVVPYQGKHYNVVRTRGSTEHQEVDPYDDYEKVPLIEVELKEVITKKWMPV